MDPFIGTIIMFGGDFEPRGWAMCNGQLLAISSNNALFSILGTTYGGDGRTTFGLPDLRGRVPVHPGNGPGLSPYNLGQKGGEEGVTLAENEIPPLNSYFSILGKSSAPYSPTNQFYSIAKPRVTENIYNATGGTASQNIGKLAGGGAGLPHENVQPYSCINFIIALEGLFPSRT